MAEQSDRLARLRAAIMIAAEQKPRLVKGDLRTDLVALAREAPLEVEIHRPRERALAGLTVGTPKTASVSASGSRDWKFADSLLEGDGFELLVPPRRNSVRARHVVSAHGPPARRGIDPETDEKFESGFLQRGVCCEPDPLDQGAELQLAGHRMPDSHSCTRLLAPL